MVEVEYARSAFNQETATVNDVSHIVHNWGQDIGDFVWIVFEIRVLDNKDIPGCVLDSDIDSARFTAVRRLADQFNGIGLRCIILNDLGSLVRGRIVDHDDFSVWERQN